MPWYHAVQTYCQSLARYICLLNTLWLFWIPGIPSLILNCLQDVFSKRYCFFDVCRKYSVFLIRLKLVFSKIIDPSRNLIWVFDVLLVRSMSALKIRDCGARMYCELFLWTTGKPSAPVTAPQRIGSSNVVDAVQAINPHTNHTNTQHLSTGQRVCSALVINIM